MGSCGFWAYFFTSKGIRFNHRIDLAEYFIPSHREKFKHGQLMKEEDNLNTHVQTIRMVTIIHTHMYRKMQITWLSFELYTLCILQHLTGCASDG